jgi:hypothetical protein
MAAQRAAVARFVVAITFGNRIAKLAPELPHDRDASEQIVLPFSVRGMLIYRPTGNKAILYPCCVLPAIACVWQNVGILS